VRVLDLRLAIYRDCWWCAHTFLTIPLKCVIEEIEEFMKMNPKETVVVLMTADYSPIKADREEGEVRKVEWREEIIRLI